MTLVWTILAKTLSSPVVSGILIPTLSRALEGFFIRLSNQIEEKGALKQAKAAKTAEELRAASKRLSDATSRK
jgi:hypothetical protein